MKRLILPTTLLATSVTLLSRENVVYAKESKFEDEMKLVKVQAVFRHGARSPLNELPDERTVEWYDCENFKSSVGLDETPYETQLIHTDHSLIGNCVKGQLTKQGMLQMQVIGGAFFDRYRSFIMDNCSKSSNLNDSIYVRCTEVAPRRTEYSAMGFLSGVITKLSKSSGRPFDHYITPTIYRHEYSKETLYPNPALCPAIGQLLTKLSTHIRENYLSREDIQEFTEELEGIFETNKLPGYEFLLNGVTMLKLHGKKLPEGLTDEHIERIERIATDVAYGYINMNDEMSTQVTKLSIGPFMNELVDRMQDHINSSSSTKTNKSYKHKPLELYFGHDNTLIPIIAGLRVTQQAYEWPPVGSGIEFQLYRYKQHQQYYVKMLYNGRALILPGAQSYYCPFSHFKTLCRELHVEDIAQVCTIQRSR